MSNRYNNKNRAARRRNGLRRLIEAGLPHGTKLRLKRELFLRTRQRNLASATRHLSHLAECYEKGVTTEERGGKRKIVLTPRNRYRAEMLNRAREATVQLAESLPRLR